MVELILVLPRTGGFPPPAGNPHARKERLDFVCDLSPEISESSGLIWFNNKFWTFNDSGGGPVLYGFNTDSANIVQTITVTNARNVDWEEITQDQDYIYIGDFGNNLGNRKDLKIYKIKKSDIPRNNPHGTVAASEISFSFANQKNFRPGLWHARYDCEAMVAWGDSLVVFTKDWEREISQFYLLPKSPGRYSPQPSGTFPARGLVTGAAYDSSRHLLALCGYEDFVPFVWYVFPNKPQDIAKAERHRYTFWNMAGVQTEGICFGPDSAIYLSSEKSRFRQALYCIRP